MDVLSHGLWGSIAFGRKNRKSFWLAFFIGIAPDVFSFGILFFSLLFFGAGPRFNSGPPDASLVPGYIDSLYNITHSLVIFAVVFFIFWAILKRPVLELLAWGIHILFDIFTHSFQFFPTPFLWPISDYKLDAISWGTPWIFIPNVALLLILYIWFFISKRNNNKSSK
jgi:hypothetical protein